MDDSSLIYNDQIAMGGCKQSLCGFCLHGSYVRLKSQGYLFDLGNGTKFCVQKVNQNDLSLENYAKVGSVYYSCSLYKKCKQVVNLQLNIYA